MAALSREEQAKQYREMLAAVMSGGPARPQAGQYQPAFVAPTRPVGAAFSGAAPNTMGGSSTLGSVPPTINAPAQAASAQAAPMQGPVNMNVIKFLNQYAEMGDPQGYADKFADGDLSKLKARTYRDNEGNPYNDYYVKGLLGG